MPLPGAVNGFEDWAFSVYTYDPNGISLCTAASLKEVMENAERAAEGIRRSEEQLARHILEGYGLKTRFTLGGEIELHGDPGQARKLVEDLNASLRGTDADRERRLAWLKYLCNEPPSWASPFVVMGTTELPAEPPADLPVVVDGPVQ